MRVEQLVRELGLRLSLSLVLDQNGMCRMVFDGKTIVDLEALRGEGEKFIIYATVAKLRPGPREALYRALLEANLPGDTNGDFSVDIERSEVLLQRTFNAERVTPPYVAEVVEKFVKRAAAWSERIDRFDQASPSHQADDLPPTVDDATFRL